MSNTRTILHIKVVNFPSAVERIRCPDLVDKPLIIGHARSSTSGVVYCTSEEARECGVEEGMSLRRAQRSCPDAVVLQADLALYKQENIKYLDILMHYSPLLEPDLLGSAYLDITACRNLFGSAKQVAEEISSKVSSCMGLTVNVGCASNKLLARVASSASRPFARVREGFESKALAPLPVNMLEPVNTRIEKRLSDLGVITIGQLALIPEQLLVRLFGPVGSLMKMQAQGIDMQQVKAAYPFEVIKSEQMFSISVEEPLQVEERLLEMLSSAQMQMRRKNMLAGEVLLTLYVSAASKVLSVPSYFRFRRPTDSIAHIKQVLSKLLMMTMKPGMEVVGACIEFSDLTSGVSAQLCLVGEGERENRLDRAVDLLRKRFGDNSVLIASSLTPSSWGGALSEIAA